MKEEKNPEFTKRFEEYVAANIQPNQLTPQIEIDACIPFSEITQEFVSILRLFNPFGPGNQKPLFCTRGVRDYGTSKLVGKNLEHIKLELVDESSTAPMDCIAFNMAGRFDHIHSGKPFDICYTIEENKHHMAKSTIQLLVKDIHVAD